MLRKADVVSFPSRPREKQALAFVPRLRWLAWYGMASTPSRARIYLVHTPSPQHLSCCRGNQTKGGRQVALLLLLPSAQCRWLDCSGPGSRKDCADVWHGYMW
jgi:hypothetical protein